MKKILDGYKIQCTTASCYRSHFQHVLAALIQKKMIYMWKLGMQISCCECSGAGETIPEYPVQPMHVQLHMALYTFSNCSIPGTGASEYIHFFPWVMIVYCIIQILMKRLVNNSASIQILYIETLFLRSAGLALPWKLSFSKCKILISFHCAFPVYECCEAEYDICGTKASHSNWQICW